jgi:hypothetical protein
MALLPAHKTLPEGPLFGLMPSLLNAPAVNLITARKIGPSAEALNGRVAADASFAKAQCTWFVAHTTERSFVGSTKAVFSICERGQAVV